jgi:hypothetical protein
MATRTFTALSLGTRGILVTWNGLLNGDDGTAFEAGDITEATIQATGTFGVGGSITLQASNDGVNWFAATDAANVACTFTAQGGDAPVQTPRYWRPIVTAGDGTTALVAVLMLAAWRR